MALNTLQRSLKEFLEKHGIETCVFVVRDPDTALTIQHRRGDRLWMIGALEAEKHEVIANWVELEPKESD